MSSSDLPNVEIMHAGFQANADAFITVAATTKRIADQIALLPRSPIMQSQEIMEAIRALGRDLQRETSAIRSEMRNGFGNLTTEMRARDYNNQARIYNARITAADAPLRPLRNISTDQPLPDFPQNLKTLQAMNKTQLRELLLALGLTPSNLLTEARGELRLAIGCAEI